VLLFVFW